jgi:hydrogenase expression/formation protein HypC
MGKVDFAGVKKDVCLQWLEDVKVGDYVLVHVGFALNKIDEQEASSTIALLREMGELAVEKKETE